MQICCQLFFAIFKQRIQQASSAIMHDANIVHAVKKCYKLKIDSRDLKSRFYDVIRACHHIFKQKSLRCIANVVLLEANGTTIAMQRRLK